MRKRDSLKKIEATQAAQQRGNDLQTAAAQAQIEREKARGEIELKREELKTEATRKRAEHFAKIGEMYIKRYLAAYDRLINIKDRIVAHIEKIEANGQDASAAKIELDKATPILAKALTAIDELKTSKETDCNSCIKEDKFNFTISINPDFISKSSTLLIHILNASSISFATSFSKYR